MFRSNSTWKYNKPARKNKVHVVGRLWRFTSKKHNVFTEEVNIIAFRANDDKIILQSIDSIKIRLLSKHFSTAGKRL